MIWKIISSKNGYPVTEVEQNNRRICLHSKYDPIKDAERWVTQCQIDVETVKKVYVLGMGNGYHILELTKRFPHLQIEVWDFNNSYKRWLLNQDFFNEIVKYSNITYISSESLDEINESFFKKIFHNDTKLYIYKPSLNLIPEHLEYLRTRLEEIVFINNSYLNLKDYLNMNFINNIRLNDKGFNHLEKNFTKKPCLLISAGPSLTKQLPLIKEISNTSNFLIGCVGTALKSLLKYEVNPDFVMISDPLDDIYNQIQGIDTRNLTMYYLSTANHKTVAAFKGARIIVWQSGYEPAENKAKMLGDTLIKTGGSVATCLLDLLTHMGGNPIALVGQDLAYTDGLTHAEDVYGNKFVSNHVTTVKVKDYYQKKMLSTSRNLTIYRKWFERYVKYDNRNIEFWNCTEGGAYIEGWIHRPLKEFYEKYTK